MHEIVKINSIFVLLNIIIVIMVTIIVIIIINNCFFKYNIVSKKNVENLLKFPSADFLGLPLS